MADIKINIHAKDLLADTSSLLEVYINDHLEARLSETNQTYSGVVTIPRDDADIVLVRRYHAANAAAPQGEEGNIFAQIAKKTVAFLSRFLLAYVPNEPFDCVYEAKECFYATELKANSAITFVCGIDASNRRPRFVSQSDGCHIVSVQKKYQVSQEEIKDNYREQKKYMEMLGFGVSALLLAFLVLSLIAENVTTALFLGIIIGLIVCCCLFSLNNLRKEYLRKYSQAAEQMDESF